MAAPTLAPRRADPVREAVLAELRAAGVAVDTWPAMTPAQIATVRAILHAPPPALPPARDPADT